MVKSRFTVLHGQPDQESYKGWLLRKTVAGDWIMTANGAYIGTFKTLDAAKKTVDNDLGDRRHERL